MDEVLRYNKLKKLNIDLDEKKQSIFRKRVSEIIDYDEISFAGVREYTKFFYGIDISERALLEKQ